MPLDKIARRDDVEVDEIFTARYGAFLLGKTTIHETRLSLNTVRRGFWKKVAGEWSHVEDSHSEDGLADVIAMIRLGSRPAVHVYENPNPADDKRFVCPDDCVVHLAYERLGIVRVPAVLMAKPRGLEESCLSVRFYRPRKKDRIALLAGVVSVTHEKVPSILGKERVPTTASLDRLLQRLSKTKTNLKTFHHPGSTELHYHHTLYSVLIRAEESVASMKLLMDAGKSLAAAGLLRSLYELALVFYIDWLAPSHMYRYLQMAAVQSEREWERRCEEGRIADLKGGATIAEAKDVKDGHLRAFRLASVVGERARVFPLGEEFHKDVYSFLSDVIHHDFSMTARYAHTLEHGDEAVYQEGVYQTVVHLSDILIAAIVSRIEDDIGNISDLVITDR